MSSGVELRSATVVGCERAIMISLAGPLAERRKHREIECAGQPDAEGWRRFYDPKIPLAIHEAGHAVARLVLGEPVRLVSIRPLPNSLGRVVGGDEPVEPDYDAPAGSSDHRHVVDRLRLLWLAHGSPGWRDLRAILRRLRGETEALLDCHWHQVERLAGCLLVRTELDRAEIDGLLAGLRPTGPRGA